MQSGDGMPVLEEVAFSNGPMLNGAAVSRSGRVFASFPKWIGQKTFGVGVAGHDGEFVPYPGNDWNDYAGDEGESRFATIHSIHIDKYDRLWVVDAGKSPFGNDGRIVRPKLIQFNPATDQAERVYVLDELAAPVGSSPAHVRADLRHAYITDPRFGALIVVDLESGRGRRVLERHPLTAADPSIIPLADGVPLLIDGKPLVAHVDLLELSPDGEWLYFSALFGPNLYRAPVRVLTDAALSDPEIAEHVEFVTKIPPVSGMIHGPDGSLYLSSLTDRSILRLKPGASETELLIRDQRLDSPNESSVSRDGYLYVPASQANSLPVFHNGVSRLQPPFRVYRVKLPGAP